MEKRTVLNGLSIAYREEGFEAPAEDERFHLPIVVLIHGWGANYTLFDSLFRLVARRYRVMGMDMPGFGKSDEPAEPYDLNAFADFIRDLLRQLYPEEQSFILLGHSHGGRTILRLLARGDLPFEVPKAILVDSAGIVPEKTKEQQRRTKLYKTGRGFLEKTGLSKSHPELLEALQKKFGSADYAAASPVMRRSMVMNVNTDLREEMPAIKIPVLLIWGDADTATPLKDGQTMEQLMPEAGLAVIPGAGHFSFLDNPGLFQAILASFLAIG